MRIGLFGRQLAILRCLARIFCNMNRHVDHWRTAKMLIGCAAIASKDVWPSEKTTRRLQGSCETVSIVSSRPPTH